VQSRPAFEIPFSEISNTNLAGKNEVAVEFSLPATGDDSGTNGSLGGARARGKKAGGGLDQLVEMRFYVPGTAKRGEDDDEAGNEEEEEEQNAANLFYETLVEKAEIGEVAGDTFATFLDVLHLTPRGRFDIDMYENSFRLRGKTYDYKIQFDSIKKFMLLPKPDDVHILIVVGLDPPLRQGQTRYPFLVMQFKRDEDVTLDLNMTEELLEERYKGKLQSHYEAPISNVVAQIFRGVAGKKVITPAKDFSSHHSQAGVKCSIKANEGLLFCLDKSFMFVPKPATYISFENISVIVMSRVGGALAASRTFDITVTLKSGMGEHQFSNINREEQRPLEDFFKLKGIKVKNEMTEDVSSSRAASSSPLLLTCSSRREPSSQRLSRTIPILSPVTTRSWGPTVAVPMRTMRVWTRTLNQIQIPTLPRSLTRNMQAVEAAMTTTWTWETMTPCRNQSQKSGRRRRPRPRNEKADPVCYIHIHAMTVYWDVVVTLAVPDENLGMLSCQCIQYKYSVLCTLYERGFVVSLTRLAKPALAG
jgi:hypothetical protein